MQSLLGAILCATFAAAPQSAAPKQDPAAAPAVAVAEGPSAKAEAVAPAAEDGNEPAVAEDPADDEGEEHGADEASAVPGLRYTSDIADEDLEKRWSEAPDSLGSLSIGYADAGRLINGVPFPQGKNWVVVDPKNTFGTEETVAYLAAAANEVAKLFDEVPPLRVNHMSRAHGGWLRPHSSHQAGRDVDLGFYRLQHGKQHGAFDVAKNWALVRSLITLTDVQVILVDRRIQKDLIKYALSIGEDKAWIDSIFNAGRQSIVMHARRHRDHFHVRFFNPRAQELGRRVQPLLAKGKPENNVAIYKIKRGDTLSTIAQRYDTTVNAIRKTNGMSSSRLGVGRTLLIPLNKPCTNCPLPPEVVVPPRRLPPTTPLMFARDKVV